LNPFFDIIENIKEIDAKSEILITSYQFDPDFFEKYVFSHFRPPSYPLIFIDSMVYQENKKSFIDSQAGRRYFVESVSCPHIFHPKLLLSISEKMIFILIGSNNLTIPGYTTNAEIITPIWIDLENPENEYILEDLKSFLQGLHGTISSDINKQYLRRIIELIPEKEKQPGREAWILNNIGVRPLIQQIAEIINEPISEMRVICPYFSQNPQFYEEMLTGCNHLSIYFQQNISNLPIESIKVLKGIRYFSLETENDRILHAKVLFFETPSTNYIFSGSANFTESALTTSNNIELGILVKTTLPFEKIISPIGKYEEITPDNIVAQSDQTIKSEGKAPLNILETTLKENEIIVTVESTHNLSDFSLVINEKVYNPQFSIKGNSLIFTIDDEILNLFRRSVAIEVIGRRENEVFSSNYRILHNKAIFPDEFMVLNYADIEDVNWLFKIFEKLKDLPSLHSYFKILDEIDDRRILEGKNKQKELSHLAFKTEPYNPSLNLNELINRFITRHQSRIKNSIKNFDQNDLSVVMNSFILTNRLILWSIARDVKRIHELSLININLKDLFLSRPNYLDRLDDKGVEKCLVEFNLKAHIAILIYLIDYLQQKSPEFNVDPRLGYNSVKRAFEQTTVMSLIKLIEKSDSILSKDELIAAMKYYSEIMPSMKQISIMSFETRINDLIHNVGMDQHKITII